MLNILSGDEHFTYDGVPINRLLNDFWAWQSSDLLDVYVRGSMSEYIVATALGLDYQARANWLDHDLDYGDTRIEIKSSANILIDNSNYLPVKMKENSKIIFNIGENKKTHSVIDESWNEQTAYRHSDIYIFCVFRCKNLVETNPMQLEQWEFYIMKTSSMNELLGSQKTISLSALLKLPVSKCNYEELQETLDFVISGDADE